MAEVISVRFKGNGKVYFFDPNGIEAQAGQDLIVETSKGLEYAECVQGNHAVEDDSIIPPLRPVIRIATAEDQKRNADNKAREKRAFDICLEKIEKHGLDMKLVDVEYNFEGNKILFFFTSDGRVNFRDLVKDLASVFKARIELRQIGVRDEARMIGGLGICGKPFCCTQFLDDFQPVSIKMAKTQGLSLNPTKISGTCGRLMCCLKYEQEAYEELVKNVPKVDAFVETPMGKGSVTDVNLLRSQVRVRLEEQNEPMMRTFPASEVTVLGGKAMRAEFLAAKAEAAAERMKNAPVRLRPERPRRDVKKQPLGTLDDFVKNQGRPAVTLSPEPAETAESPSAPSEASPAPRQEHREGGSHRRGRRGGSRNKSSRPPQNAAGSTAPAAPQASHSEKGKSNASGQTGAPASGTSSNSSRKRSNNRYRRYRHSGHQGGGSGQGSSSGGGSSPQA